MCVCTSPALHWCPIQGVFLPCAQFSRCSTNMSQIPSLFWFVFIDHMGVVLILSLVSLVCFLIVSRYSMLNPWFICLWFLCSLLVLLIVFMRFKASFSASVCPAWLCFYLMFWIILTWRCVLVVWAMTWIMKRVIFYALNKLHTCLHTRALPLIAYYRRQSMAWAVKGNTNMKGDGFFIGNVSPYASP